MAVSLNRRRFTVDEWEQMIKAGIFPEDERIELIEGEIVEMAPIGDPHIGCVNYLTRAFVRLAGDRAIVSVQNSVRIGDLSMPQPDLALIRPREDWYRSTRIRERDVLLLVEVSDTTVRTDRGVKLPLYARAGIVEVWLVNLPEGQVEVYRDPGPDGYADVSTVGVGGRVSMCALDGVTLDVGEILGA